MTLSLSSVLILQMSVELKLNVDINWTIKLSQKQKHVGNKTAQGDRYQQCNKPEAIRESGMLLAQSY